MIVCEVALYQLAHNTADIFKRMGGESSTWKSAILRETNEAKRHADKIYSTKAQQSLIDNDETALNLNMCYQFRSR